MRRPVTDLALLSYIARKNADIVSYTEATKACKSSSSASRALHQLISEGLIEPKPKLLGLRYVTEYAITPRGKQVSQLALQITELREASSRMKKNQEDTDEANYPYSQSLVQSRKILGAVKDVASSTSSKSSAKKKTARN